MTTSFGETSIRFDARPASPALFPWRTSLSVWTRRPGVELSATQCRQLLDKLLSKGVEGLNGRQKRALGRTRIGRHVVWATFDAEDDSRRPFDRIGHRRAAVRAALGLGALKETDRVLLLTYAPERLAKVRRPTVADAAESHWYRSHAVPGASHGWTCPLEPCPAHVAPQPEVVHDAMCATGIRLDFPVEEVR